MNPLPPKLLLLVVLVTATDSTLRQGGNGPSLESWEWTSHGTQSHSRSTEELCVCCSSGAWVLTGPKPGAEAWHDLTADISAIDSFANEVLGKGSVLYNEWPRCPGDTRRYL